ncbi:hypothetical protein [Clostridium butyricum]|uniref:hypothetical protein n=1 Tax=Clostridium butyricum TaxID=1492 RepID=UPI0022E71934|nr:hypothetical protein [Clostridium butyricum]
MKKKILCLLLTVLMITSTAIPASAAWIQDNNGWWYTEGSSCATGWKLIDGNWYYFYSDGYMAHDCWIGNYYLNAKGAWTTETITKEKAQQIVDELKNSKYFGNNIVFKYNPIDNYMSKDKQQYYYIFNMIYGEDEADKNICVDKYSGEVYICTPEKRGGVIYKIDDYYTKYNIYK